MKVLEGACHLKLGDLKKLGDKEKGFVQLDNS